MESKEHNDDTKRTLERLEQLRDEVKVHLHLASLDAKKEWDEKLSPRLFEVEQSAKQIAESPRSSLRELVAKLEEFLARLRSSGPSPAGA